MDRRNQPTEFWGQSVSFWASLWQQQLEFTLRFWAAWASHLPHLTANELAQEAEHMKTTATPVSEKAESLPSGAGKPAKSSRTEARTRKSPARKAAPQRSAKPRKQTRPATSEAAQTEQKIAASQAPKAAAAAGTNKATAKPALPEQQAAKPQTTKTSAKAASTPTGKVTPAAEVPAQPRAEAPRQPAQQSSTPGTVH